MRRISPMEYQWNENHFVNFTGATKKPKAYTSMRKVVYINKFVAGYGNIFYLKCSSEKKRLNTNVKGEMISACVLIFDNRITLRLSLN